MEETKTTSMPGLTLDPFGDAAVQPETQTQQQTASLAEEAKLTPEEKQMVENFSKQINLTDSNMIISYGAAAQQKIADFSDNALENVKSQDLGEVGGLLTDMVVELKKFEPGKKKKGLFRKAQDSIEALKAKYATAESNINKIVGVLEKHQINLMKDIATLDKLYEINLNDYKELTMYIMAGKQKLEQVRSDDLPKLVAKAQASNDQADIQAAEDLSAKCDRFEKKLHDLELTRVVSMQMAPQIRMIQNNDTLMAEKIQSSLVNTIPLWKSQMVIALGIAHSTEAAQAQHQVSEMTNNLLKKNAESLKQNTIETAKESERSIIDIETLKKTNESLISTFDEVIKIQDEGRQKRADAEKELSKIEGDLKQKLLEVSQQRMTK